MAIQNDGKILIGGGFKVYNGVTKNYITRILANGKLDNSFDTGTGPNANVNKILIQPDNKIILIGSFTSYNGVTKNHIVRLNADGSIDNSFDIGTGTDAAIYSIALQNDGKIIIGGAFNTYNDVARNRLARINPNGSLDASFDPQLNLTLNGYTILIQSNGQLIINDAGQVPTGFQSILRCLNSDGTIDNTFNTGQGAPYAFVYSMALQDEEKLVIGGYFTIFNGMRKNTLARLHNDNIITHTDENNSIQFSTIYPNPAQQTVSINSSKNIDRVEVYDLLSHKIMDVTIADPATDIELSTSALKNGVYLFHVTSGNNRQVFKAVIQK